LALQEHWLSKDNMDIQRFHERSSLWWYCFYVEF